MASLSVLCSTDHLPRLFFLMRLVFSITLLVLASDFPATLISLQSAISLLEKWSRKNVQKLFLFCFVFFFFPPLTTKKKSYDYAMSEWRVLGACEFRDTSFVILESPKKKKKKEKQKKKKSGKKSKKVKKEKEGSSEPASNDPFAPFSDFREFVSVDDYKLPELQQRYAGHFLSSVQRLIDLHKAPVGEKGFRELSDKVELKNHPIPVIGKVCCESVFLKFLLLSALFFFFFLVFFSFFFSFLFFFYRVYLLLKICQKGILFGDPTESKAFFDLWMKSTLPTKRQKDFICIMGIKRMRSEKAKKKRKKKIIFFSRRSSVLLLRCNFFKISTM